MDWDQVMKEVENHLFPKSGLSHREKSLYYHILLHTRFAGKDSDLFVQPLLTGCFRAWRAMGLESPCRSKPLISCIARDTLFGVACSIGIGERCPCLYLSYNCGGSAPAVFSQSQNTLGLSLNHFEIFLDSRPNVKAIPCSFPLLIPPSKFTHRLVHHPKLQF